MRYVCGPRHSIRPPRVAVTDKPVIRPHEEIARIAYRYWESRGKQGGSPLEDWYRAEREWDLSNLTK